ncbi:hypothetical protein [Bacillus cereus]|uniref:hypothetical protein n=1 Tax=Bacillus cereus TaxID=1396 RepID=UPI001E2F0472|nr:hypothetical protein [Bacillus cereus]
MKYFEFNNHEYWALVAAESEEKAHQVYTEEGEECRYTSKEEGPVTEISKEIAFDKYIGTVAHIEENQGRGLLGLIHDFLNHKNTTVLIISELA